MITEINIKNFKSIVDLTLPLSNINVFIGENGCGKSNILEAIGFASAAAKKDLSDVQLVSKGIRIAKSSLILNSFKDNDQEISEVVVRLVSGKNDFGKFYLVIKSQHLNDVLVTWKIKRRDYDEYDETFEKNLEENEKALEEFSREDWDQLRAAMEEYSKETGSQMPKFSKSYRIPANIVEILHEERIEKERLITDFVIYALSNSALRGVQSDSLIKPLGIFGEGLDELIASFDEKEREFLTTEQMISWLDEIIIDEKDTLKLKGLKPGRSTSRLFFKDKFMLEDDIFSSENANEGVLHVLFYLSLFISKNTPMFFGIDNIETALNPKLCRDLIKKLSEIAIKNGKQVVITTHNPAILDGLNLHDDQQRLFVVKRNDEGHTKIERIKLKPAINGEQLKLSEMWMRGYIGGLPTNF